MKKPTTRYFRSFKKSTANKTLSMLTCYDFQTANLLNETALDLILVGDSVGNVILGYDTTVEVTLDEMIIFASAVKRGAPDKFVIADMPFGSYANLEMGLRNAIKIFQKSKVQALKIEGAFGHHLELIKSLTENGIPIVGHIGLTPQSVHQQGGYYTHGRDDASSKRIIEEARALEKAGVFMLVLECVEPKLSAVISSELSIPTVGIGSGSDCDGQVLVLNDLLKLGKSIPPKFCTPIADLYQVKKDLISKYLDEL